MKNERTILLVEDDEFVSKAYGYFLRQAGFKVVFAYNGIEAKQKIKAKLPDLILLDIIMPEMNGFEFLEELKKKRILGKVPVIVVSNLSHDSDIAECKKLGVADYLIKSNFFMKDVIEKVKFHLSKKLSESGAASF